MLFGKFAIISTQNIVPGDFHIAPPFCPVTIFFASIIIMFPYMTDFSDKLLAIPQRVFNFIQVIAIHLLRPQRTQMMKVYLVVHFSL